MSESNKSILEAKNRQMPGAPTWLKCCATCEKLSDNGHCEAFDDYPPINYIEKENDCQEHGLALPF